MPRAQAELRTTLYSVRREFVVAAGFGMVANLLMLAPVIYMLQVYDRVLVSRNELTLLTLSLLTLFLLAAIAMAEWFRSRLLVRTGVKMDSLLAHRVFTASFQAARSPLGNTPERPFGDLTELRQFLTGSGIHALLDAPWTPVYIGVLFLLHPLLGATALAFALVQVLLAWAGHRFTTGAAHRSAVAQGQANAFLHDKLTNTESLGPMGLLTGLHHHWALLQNRYRLAEHMAQGRGHGITAVSRFVRYTQQSLALGVGALLAIDGQISPGSMIAANVLMTRALAPIDMLTAVWRGLLGARAAFDRLSVLFEQHPESVFATEPVPKQVALTLRNVVAQAKGRSSPILQVEELTCQPATVTAIVGPSGSGKSTLARVMLGIWPDTQGEVLLGNVPAARWDREILGARLGYLPQSIDLLDGTIAENIARFGPVDSEAVIQAAKLTGLHETLLKLPHGYDTPVGTAGGSLPGGLRQRIGLARAVYGMPDLLVLDEPNAHLDEPGETALLATVKYLKQAGKIVVIISHRPHLLAVADRVVVVHDGRIRQPASDVQMIGMKK